MVSNEEIKRMLKTKRNAIDLRKDEAEGGEFRICPYCKAKNMEKALFCIKCGHKLEKIKKNVKICPACGAENTQEAKFCINCGESLEVKKENLGCEIKSEPAEEVKDAAETETVPKEPVEAETLTDKTPFKGVESHEEAEDLQDKKICPSCKSKNLKDAKFCIVCGKTFKEMETTASDEDINSKSKVPEEPSVDPVEKIKKAKELLDLGAITQEEFDEVKKKYLGKI